MKEQWSKIYQVLNEEVHWITVRNTCKNCGLPRGQHRAGDLLCPFRLLNGRVAANPWKYRRGFRTWYKEELRLMESEPA